MSPSFGQVFRDFKCILTYLVGVVSVVASIGRASVIVINWQLRPSERATRVTSEDTKASFIEDTRTERGTKAEARR